MRETGSRSTACPVSGDRSKGLYLRAFDRFGLLHQEDVRRIGAGERFAKLYARLMPDGPGDLALEGKVGGESDTDGISRGEALNIVDAKP